MINSPTTRSPWTGWTSPRPIATITEWLVGTGTARRPSTYKLRDWLFTRQRYWGEPFPIVYDENGLPVAAARDSMLPVLLPEVDDYSPKTFAADDADSEPEPPLSRATEWTTVELDLGDGPKKLPPRDQHDAPVGRVVLVLPALPGPGRRQDAGRPGARAVLAGPATRAARATSAASTCTSAGSSTPCCTCCTPGSGTRCCTTWATCQRGAVPPAGQPGLHLGVRLHRRARLLRARPRRSWRRTAGAFTWTASRSTGSTGRSARA